jgi:branched-chain amino acid transport system ATP-binding protein
MTDPATPALETRGLTKTFGSLVVAGGIDFRLKPGARHALIGPNGAGKTTFLNLLTGQTAPAAGSVWLAGAEVTGLSTHQRVRQGLARTFQINALLRDTTVLENVQLAVLERWRCGARLLGGRGAQRRAAEAAFDILERLRLDAFAGTRVGLLPYGRQRLVEIAIALALEPRVLLLDEPAAGVPPGDSHLVFDLLAALPADISILIIEHDMKLVFRFAERISVLVAGRVLTEGTPGEIAADPRVRDVYLGTRHG